MPGTKKQQPAPSAPAPVFRLKISLEGIAPTIWRRLQVPGNASLGWLHAAIQVAMGWSNSHLHQFVVGERRYSDPGLDPDEHKEGPRIHDEGVATILDIPPRARRSFRYEYDFGDGWIHRIAVERILDPDPALAEVAQCLDGARACPPENCGGAGGYAALLEIIMDPKHQEYDSMMEWLGGGFDPEAFDRHKANAHLRRLKWPRVTEQQLAGILLRRDGVKG
jgi:hypothetical protein